ncbi:hypothetical protein EXE48_11870 [Halorubrum sp. ASP1]|uniref:DNA N-6-adenine-methyltransferase n=1 Tax=Halorubrum sp. ASP1 TaxID=2518114 RepID=UPI0010F744AE|nr:DNA N-6-adenine-methyltransferase [Halorubrum sp. ASP1]TKX60663.1 hypothetical protein EXE48_11870 [Halorubrum sp. ASP1]
MSNTTKIAGAAGKPDSEATQRDTDTDSDSRGTPEEIMSVLIGALGRLFDLDPCSGAENTEIAKRVFTESDNGLSKPWYGRIWLNPPYSDIDPWFDKAVSEVNSGRAEFVLALIPSYGLSADWFHDHASDASILAPIDGRLNFTNTDGAAPFASLFMAFGTLPESLRLALSELGTVYRVEADSGNDLRQQSYLFEIGNTQEQSDSQSGVVLSTETDVATIATAAAGDTFRLSIDTDMLGTPEDVQSDPVVTLQTTRTRNDHIEHLLLDESTETWYMIRIGSPDGNGTVFGGGSSSTDSFVSAAAQVGGQGWTPISLRQISIPPSKIDSV